MRLLEYQAKELLREAGLDVPRGGVARHLAEVANLGETYGPRVVVKAQVRTGGRGKAGGILPVDGPRQAQLAAERLFGGELRGERIETVLVEERIEAVAELYLSLVTDREVGSPVVLVGAVGGVEIQSFAAQQPAALARAHLDLALGLTEYQVRYLVNRAGLPPGLRPGLSETLRGLERLYRGYDALLAEINPLAVLADGRLVALDARVEIDDNALFRQPRIAALRTLSPVAQRVEAAAFHYVELDGQVGLISTGSGACMALMDLLAAHGLQPANFIELGQSMGTGGAQVATEILLERPEVKAVLVAGYSGGPLDRLAAGVLEILAENPRRDLPVVLSLQGRNDAEAMRLAAQSRDPRVHAAPGYRAAVERVASLLGRP